MSTKWLMIVMSVLAVGVVRCAAENATAAPSKLVNPFEAEGTWFKANLHTHTTTSDGDVNVAVKVKQYRDKGYQVLAVTDHEKTNKVAGYSDKDFLLISGMETHPRCPTKPDNTYHLVCLNVPEGLSFTADVNIAERIRRVKAGGGEVIYGHPHWCGHTINELMAVDGYIGIEVYNHTCWAKADSSALWDDVLMAGRIVPAIAVDDLHNSCHIGKGWIMIKAKELTTEAIMDAMRKGSYYATCGPTIEDFRLENGVVKVKCSPVVNIYLIGQSHNMNWDSRRWSPKEVEKYKNVLLTNVEYELPKGFTYVRAEVVDANGRHAWTSPIEIRDSKVKVQN